MHAQHSIAHGKHTQHLIRSLLFLNWLCPLPYIEISSMDGGKNESEYRGGRELGGGDPEERGNEDIGEKAIKESIHVRICMWS